MVDLDSMTTEELRAYTKRTLALVRELNDAVLGYQKATIKANLTKLEQRDACKQTNE